MPRPHSRDALCVNASRQLRRVLHPQVRDGCGRSSARERTRPGPTMMLAAWLRGSICHSNSRQRPHGARMPSALTATASTTCDSRALSNSATAACSAQNPSPHAGVDADAGIDAPRGRQEGRRHAAGDAVVARPELARQSRRDPHQLRFGHADLRPMIAIDGPTPTVRHRTRSAVASCADRGEERQRDGEA